MTNRKCIKCGGQLILNEKLGFMECIEQPHIEPINLKRAQWWNKCPKCNQLGLNDRDGEARVQRIEKVKVDGKIVKRPVVHTVGDKDNVIVFDVQIASPITCKACGHSFTKE